MTRMVEEQRTQIGTLKALGYKKSAIAAKYICYAFFATLLGSVLGMLIGEKIIPYIIITAYGIMYHNVANTISIDLSAWLRIDRFHSLCCMYSWSDSFCKWKGAAGDTGLSYAPTGSERGQAGIAGAAHIYMEAFKLFLEVHNSKSFPLQEAPDHDGLWNCRKHGTDAGWLWDSGFHQ